MTTSQYLTLTTELGISRGALAEGFPTGPTSKAWDTELPDRRDARRKPKPPPIEEDLSRFVQPKRKTGPKLETCLYRVREDLRPLYSLLYARGMTPSHIAEKLGISPSQVHATLRGNKTFHRERLAKLLTSEEMARLNWKSESKNL